MVVGFQDVDDFLFVGTEFRRFFYFIHRGLLSLDGPSELESDVVGIAEEEGTVGGDEVVGASGVGIGDASGEGEDFALVGGGNGGGDEGATFLGSLHNDRSIAEGGNDAVACGEESRVDGGAGGIFGDEGTAGLEDSFGQGTVLGRVDLVEAMSEDGNSGQLVLEGSGVGGGVDAVGQSADYRGVVWFEFADETVGIVAAVGSGAAGADNGHCAFGVEVGAAEDIEQGRTVVGFGAVEALGIVGRGEEERSDMVLLAEAEFFLGTRETIFVQYVVDDALVCAEGGFEFGFGQGEDVLVGVELNEAADGGVAESGSEGEGYLRDCLHCSLANDTNFNESVFRGF